MGKYPYQAARQRPDLSTIIRVEPSSTGGARPRDALPIPDISFLSVGSLPPQHERKKGFTNLPI
jgi:hypothetical protein